MSGLATGLHSGGVHKAISGSGVAGDGLYLHKHGKCYRVQKMKANGLYLAPHPPFVEGEGLFLKHVNDISDGAGLLIGKSSQQLFICRRDVYKSIILYALFLFSQSLASIVEQYGYVFGDNIASGPERNLQVAKKVVTTVGQFGGHINEIQQSYELGFTPHRLHTNVDGTFVTPIRVYYGRVYVLDDETTMQVTTRQIATDFFICIFVQGR